MALYQSYLLRFWQDSPQASWHASVQSVQSKEVIHFACLEDLIAFLWLQSEPVEKEGVRHTNPIQP